MGTVCRFTCGSRTFTISGIYQLASGFEPPATLEVADIATGGSANKFGGGELVSTRTLPRDYSFSILVKGNSVTQNDLAIDCEPAHREGILPDLGGYADRPVSSGLSKAPETPGDPVPAVLLLRRGPGKHLDATGPNRVSQRGLRQALRAFHLPGIGGPQPLFGLGLSSCVLAYRLP